MARNLRPTPSMVVACVALLVSLGGVGWAAVRLPAGSVGTKQLAADSVTSAKVKNGTLRRADFDPAQLPAGPAGPKGDKGEKGDTGERGATGPSDGYVDTNTGPVSFPAGTPTRVATLRLPDAGKYIVWSKVFLVRPNAGQPTDFSCALTGGGRSDIAVDSAPTGLFSTIADTLALDVDSATTVNLNCTGSGAGTANGATIAAVRVATLTSSTG